uniref:Protein three rows n=1 Tax=Glossina brevipalpis TaxID=37001 RepID=A0A1A9X492_9MUSC
MDKDFQEELIGTQKQAIAAKQQIADLFEKFNKSEDLGAKNQLIFATKTLRTISRCEGKHLHIYSDILNNIFGTQLKPEASEKYWTIFVDYVRHIHYLFVDKKEYGQAWLTFKTISGYKSKVQTESVSKFFIKIYSYQLYLEIGRLEKDMLQAIEESKIVVKALSNIFQEMLQRNHEMNYQYLDILTNSLQWLMPISKVNKMSILYTALPKADVEAMFKSLFQLYASQRLTIKPTKQTFDKHLVECLEALHGLLQFDVATKLDFKLSLLLLKFYRSSSLLKTHEAIITFFQFFAEYMETLFSKNPAKDYKTIFYKRCNDLKTYFESNSKIYQSEAWFSQSIVIVSYVNTQLLNLLSQKIAEPRDYNALLELMAELVKSCASVNESRCCKVVCCSNVRKHLIIGFAQVALATHVIYAEFAEEKKETLWELLEEPNGRILDSILKNILFIVNYGFKVIKTMDCITPTCQDMQTLLTRFKQLTLKVQTDRQARTCVYLLELFLRIKQKISSKDWSCLLRRLYKMKLSFNSSPTSRELQMCFIASLVIHGQELDTTLIRSQINCFYASSENDQLQLQQHKKCLLALHRDFKSPLKPSLNLKEEKFLYWFDMQHITKYYKSNEILIQSLINFSPTQYDLVVAIRLSKLYSQTLKYVQELYAQLKEETRNRLEHLIYAHVCTLFVLEKCETRRNRPKLDSKEFLEDNLEQVLRRKEFETVSLKNELEQVELAIEAYQAFEIFYEKFDEEFISSDEALIDWELLTDDLKFLAQFLQSAGYLECSSRAWLLLYKCAVLVQDEYTALKGLTFICEYFDLIDEKKYLPCKSMEVEIKQHFPFLITSLNNINNITKRCQTTVFLAILHIAYYYARCSRYTHCQMLLQMAEEKHNSLIDRQGKYDLIKGNLDAIKIRLLWKHYDDKFKSRNQPANMLMNESLLRKIDEATGNFHEFVYISSGETLSHEILLITLTLDMAECLANRLCDNFLNSFFVTISSIALHSGLALRFVQILSLWTWINLQQEYAEKAQVKLKIMKYILGLKGFKELSKETKLTKDVMINKCKEIEQPPHPNLPMESVRKLVIIQDSSLRMDQLKPNPLATDCDLAAFFNKYIFKVMLLPAVSDVVEWSLFTVGCLTARLYFLCEDYEQLDTFYGQSYDWFQKRTNSFNKQYFKNIQLLSNQHYINYLRSQHQYNKAIKYLKDIIAHSKISNSKIDVVYKVNFELQLRSAEQEVEVYEGKHFNKWTTFKFNGSFEEKRSKAREIMREKALQEVIRLNSIKCYDIVKVEKISTYKIESNKSMERKDKAELIDLSDPIMLSASNKEQKEEYSKTSKRSKSEQRSNLELCTPNRTHCSYGKRLPKTATKLIVSSTDNSSTDLLCSSKENLNKPEKNQGVIKKRGRKPEMVKKLSAPVIVLQDSPNETDPPSSERISKGRSRLRRGATAINEVVNERSSQTSTRPRRQCRLLSDNHEKLEENKEKNLNMPLSSIRTSKLCRKL